METVEKIVFVYNADAGLLNAVWDSARKVFGASQCALCDITHGLAGERSAWKEERSTLGLEIDYVHRDEMTPEMIQQVGTELPMVLVYSKGEYKVLMDKGVLNRCKGSVSDFTGRLRYRAASLGVEIPTAPACAV